MASFVSMALFACASSSDGKTDGGTMSSSDSSMTTTTCHHASACIGGACKCTTEGPKKDQACCDPSDSACSGDPKNCDTFCEVCVTM